MSHSLAIATLLSVSLLFACDDRTVSNHCASPNAAEQMRVTSPNGLLDAVLLECLYGPPAGGGVDSNVYIVRKGAAVNTDVGREVFSADPMTTGQLVWRRDHLLEIHYDIAEIHEFRNLWGLYELKGVGDAKRNYEVEIRLVPSTDSSVLTPDGSLRTR
jgi:hypothetical protein